jgi:hypothetical protein
MTLSTKLKIVAEARTKLPNAYTFEHGQYVVPIYYCGQWIDVTFYKMREWHPEGIKSYWQTNFA